MKYLLSIGTNIGDRKQNLIDAINAINNIPYTDVISVSSVYETEPVGYARQDNFYNICVIVKSQYEPHEMLGICLGIESGLGRIRTIRFGPRLIDIDIIFAEDKHINSKNLDIPHPRYNERRFVIEPMLEICPTGEFYSIDFKKHLENIDGQDVKKVDIIDNSIWCGD